MHENCYIDPNTWIWHYSSILSENEKKWNSLDNIESVDSISRDGLDTPIYVIRHKKP